MLTTTLNNYNPSTGWPGHLAGEIDPEIVCLQGVFQTRTGHPGHLASRCEGGWKTRYDLSTPDGLPRPFSRCYSSRRRGLRNCFQPRTSSPGHLASGISIICTLSTCQCLKSERRVCELS